MTNAVEGSRRGADELTGEVAGFAVDRRGEAQPLFEFAKRAFDIAVAVAAMPFVLLLSLLLLLLNPVFNRGPVFFMQERMGRDCQSFMALKFRTMRPVDRITRGPDDPLEEDRVTGLGQFLRTRRLDELPQFINVLFGDMSLVGPRPHYWQHAVFYLHAVPGYSDRYGVRPGITGLAQVQSGYAEGVSATASKTDLDLTYIRSRGFRMESYVLWRTLCVLLTGSGAR